MKKEKTRNEDVENKAKNKDINRNKKLKIIFVIILGICLLGSISYLVIRFISTNKNRELYDDLQEKIILDEVSNEIADEPSEFKNEILENVKKLQEENSDIKGWIQIPNTNINYPLLQTTDNQYYLNHNYKGEKSIYGSIFINNNCNIKNDNGNTIIYRSLYGRWANVF